MMNTRFDSNSTNAVLSRERLKSIVPSVFTMDKKETLTERYHFIPTYEVLNTLEDLGWLPVKADEMKCRDSNNREFTKHMLRFQNFDESLRSDLLLHDANRDVESCVEMILINAHNGCASFRFLAGVFRFVCTNGMIIPEAMFGEINIRHSSYEAAKVLDVCAQITCKTPEIASSVNVMRQIVLTPSEKDAYAEGAKLLRFDNPESVSNRQVLNPRRIDDRKNDLWTVHNVVQENLVKGNIVQTKVNDKGRLKTTHTREIKAIDSNVKLNQALWAFSQKVAEYKTNPAA